MRSATQSCRAVESGGAAVASRKSRRCGCWRGLVRGTARDFRLELAQFAVQLLDTGEFLLHRREVVPAQAREQPHHQP